MTPRHERLAHISGCLLGMKHIAIMTANIASAAPPAMSCAPPDVRCAGLLYGNLKCATATNAYVNIMSAPDEFIRKLNSFSGAIQFMSITMKPNALPSRMARDGTWRAFTAVSQRGASPLSAIANSTRAVTYTPELRQDSTAVSTMTFMIVAAAGMPMRSSAMANVESPEW